MDVRALLPVFPGCQVPRVPIKDAALSDALPEEVTPAASDKLVAASLARRAVIVTPETSPSEEAAGRVLNAVAVSPDAAASVTAGVLVFVGPMTVVFLAPSAAVAV